MLPAQVKQAWGADAGIYNTSYGSFMGHVSFSRYWMPVKNFSVSLGGMMLYSSIDDVGSWQSGETFYSVDDDKIVRVNAVISATYTLPVFKQTGIYGSASAFFEPIPLNYISLDKWTATDPITQSKGKFVFTRFTPGVFADVGLYYNFVKGNESMKLFLGVGYGWYDPMIDYRNVTIDGQSLRSRISDKKDFYRFTIKLVG